MFDDGKIAKIGRDLAEALSDWAYSRKDEDKKRVVSLQHQLCKAVKDEK